MGKAAMPMLMPLRFAAMLLIIYSQSFTEALPVSSSPLGHLECIGKTPGTYCVGFGLFPGVPWMKHHLLSCPSGNRTACPSGNECDSKSTGKPHDQAACQPLSQLQDTLQLPLYWAQPDGRLVFNLSLQVKDQWFTSVSRPDFGSQVGLMLPTSACENSC